MTFFDVSILPVVVCAFSAFILGGLWYSLILPKQWQAVANVQNESAKNPAVVYPVIFILNLIAAFVFGFLFRGATFETFFLNGFLIGLTLVAFSIAINYLGANRPFKLILIDASFQLLRITTFGLVFGLFA